MAERLSDKMQIMMVPMDGRNFFAKEVFREAVLPPVATPPAESQTATRSKTARK